MPVINGFEACDRIKAYLYPKEEIKLEEVELFRRESIIKSKTLIFSLSADESDETNIEIKQHPFDDILKSLAPSEISRLISKTKQKQEDAVAQLSPRSLQKYIN